MPGPALNVPVCSKFFEFLSVTAVVAVAFAVVVSAALAKVG